MRLESIMLVVARGHSHGHNIIINIMETMVTVYVYTQDSRSRPLRLNVLLLLLLLLLLSSNFITRDWLDLGQIFKKHMTPLNFMNFSKKIPKKGVLLFCNSYQMTHAPCFEFPATFFLHLKKFHPGFEPGSPGW